MDNNCKKGVADCLRLHIHREPDLNSEILCKVRYLTELVVYENLSTDEFYRVCTATGAEGYVLKSQVIIK